MKARTLLKWVGLAGVAGVATTGAIVVRGERQRRAVTSEEVRARLKSRAQAPDRD